MMKIGDKGVVLGGAFQGFEYEVICEYDENHPLCRIDIFGRVSEIGLPLCDLVIDTAGMTEFIKDMNIPQLKILRAMINGKLGKRKITPEQQVAMQAARKRKII